MGNLLNSGRTGYADSFKDITLARFLESEASTFIDGYEPSWCVYILRCWDGTLYTGITNNMVKRLRAHREGKGAKYTRGRLPVYLELYVPVESKSEALKLEFKVKQQPRHQKIEFLRSAN
jgi:putative endonuclease